MAARSDHPDEERPTPCQAAASSGIDEPGQRVDRALLIERRAVGSAPAEHFLELLQAQPFAGARDSRIDLSTL